MARRVRGVMESSNPRNQGVSETGLYLISGAYRAAVSLRARAFEIGLYREYRLFRPVISVGNLTVGGSGKTPMTLHLAEMLARQGLQPAVLSRGYKGALEKGGGGIVSDGRNLLTGPEMAGDEPYMMAAQLRDIPFIVGADRYRAGCLAIRHFSPDVIILDDAFQHRRLYRDINLLLVDAVSGFGSGHLLPRGPLREPISAAGRADAVILTRCDRCDQKSIAAIRKRFQNIPVFESAHRPYLHGWHPAGQRLDADRVSDLKTPSDPADWTWLAGARVLAFAGIARNMEFKRMIAEKAGQPVDFISYPDHYAYTNADLNFIGARATAVNADCIVTTQKDFAKLHRHPRFPLDLAVIGVTVDFGADEHAFADWIKRRLTKPGRDPHGDGQ